ncbi:hypothetical protein DFQ27_005027 [Actinomortierella ambigua]|uniref:RING-type E3 ubiquitin transferase n=1 Tax=Actinomortierella ambigua TaxID=1343610 RepID=A0A9P6U3G2_9FUNG|nr:hypothetical protein DFQ27_005027 [Actinomortierella ambigua]
MSSNTTARRNNRDYWCHQCMTEIRPLMAPHPVCPDCNGEFVEKIESDNDPRNFVEHDHDNPDNDDESALSMDDVFRILQSLAYARQQHMSGTRPRTTLPLPGQQQDDGGAQFVFSFGSGPQRPAATTAAPPATEATGATDTHGASATTQSSVPPDGHGGHGAHAAQHPDFQGPSGILISLLERLGIPIQYTPNAAAFSTFGGGLFNMVGNPGDYAFGPNGLDDIITQLMEQQSVCKDEFTMDDNLLQLGCKHIFHGDCLKPWLKLSGTCPTCRFSIISDADREAAGRPASDHNADSQQPGAPGGSSNRSSGSQSSSSSTHQPASGNSGMAAAAAPLFSLPLPAPFNSISQLFGPRSTAQAGNGFNSRNNNNNNNNSSNSHSHSDDETPHFDQLD